MVESDKSNGLRSNSTYKIVRHFNENILPICKFQQL